MLRSLLDNIATLLVALFLALVIWMIAVRTEDPVETRTYEVPVVTTNLPAGSLLISSSQSTVQVEVEGPTSVLEEISAADLTAVVDLSAVPTGESAVDIQIQLLREDIDPDQLTISRPFPTQTRTNIDRLVTAAVPIILNVNGNVARGYERGAPFLDPELIEVTGPSSRINNLAEARVTVLLENQREDIVVLRRPIFYDQAGNVASIVGLTAETDQVQISVPVSQLAGFANKPITANWTGAPAAGYNLLDVNVTPDSILVTGSPAQLEALRLLETELIDISGLTQTFTQQVSLDLPDGIRQDEVQPIFVEFIIEPKLDSVEIDTVPEIRALAAGLTVTLGVDEVTVVLFGPVPVLETLVIDDVRVTLDLFGLTPGTYSVAPIVDVFAAEVEVRSTIPAQIPLIITDVLTTTQSVTGTVPIPTPVPRPDTLWLDGLPLFAGGGGAPVAARIFRWAPQPAAYAPAWSW